MEILRNLLYYNKLIIKCIRGVTDGRDGMPSLFGIPISGDTHRNSDACTRLDVLGLDGEGTMPAGRQGSFNR